MEEIVQEKDVIERTKMKMENDIVEIWNELGSVESDIDMMKIEEDIQPFASELESIKKALMNKDKK